MSTGMNQKTPDMLSIVEAAYCLDGSSQTWMGRLLAAAEQSIGSGLGGFACAIEAKPNGTLSFDRGSAAVVHQAPETIDAIFEGLTEGPPGLLSAYIKGGGGTARCIMTSEIDPQRKLKYRDRLARTGVDDGVNLGCLDLDDRGFLLSVGVPAGPAIDAATRADLQRVATHILAALRLRSRLGAQSPERPMARGLAEPGGAVLFPDGEVAHADGDAALAKARVALRTAVRDITRARTTARADTRHALGLWKGLVSARWTLVDHFERDGTRYVVARENTPPAKRLATLSPTELSVVTYAARGATTKEIAYTLGISDTTVRVLLMRAARRCGVRDREALLALARTSLAAPA